MKPAEEAHGYFSALNGRKYMIRGNHDRFLNNFEPFARDIKWVRDYHTFKHDDGRLFVLFHYPIAEWHGFHRGAIHLYGHIHNARESAERVAAFGSGLAFNVGVDCTGFRPVSVTEVLAMAADRSEAG
jgi:calcineurin-like phosphoesterase family protein